MLACDFFFRFDFSLLIISWLVVFWILFFGNPKTKFSEMYGFCWVFILDITGSHNHKWFSTTTTVWSDFYGWISNFYRWSVVRFQKKTFFFDLWSFMSLFLLESLLRVFLVCVIWFMILSSFQRWWSLMVVLRMI